ncbi:MAG: DUF2279 domain-containing protein [Acidobacteriota bacterium]
MARRLALFFVAALACSPCRAQTFHLSACWESASDRFAVFRDPCEGEGAGGKDGRTTRLHSADEAAVADFATDAEGTNGAAFDAVSSSPGSPKADTWWVSRSRFFDGRTIALTSGFLIYTGMHGYSTWWKDSLRFPYHVKNEGWFGRHSYTGGADHASHFVGSFIASQVLSKTYQLLGKRPAPSQRAGAVVAALGGLIIEIGDGYSVFGFSWSDIVMNTLGATAGMELSRSGLDDTLGFRIGWVPYDLPQLSERGPGTGADYSEEIYTTDLKLAGLFRRLDRNPGPARFLMVSLTYGTKGYRFHDPAVRERNVGIDVGLNLPEILRAIGVREDKWWGRPILEYLNYVRVGYTAVGFRYDLNHGRWNGPDTGEGFDPRP